MRLCLLLACLGLGSTATAADKPVPPAEVAGKFKVPPGFEVTLFASEPEIVQPIAFTFDDRGRMWVVECLSYPKWRADGTGNDRVVILEDTDGDGTHDKKTVVLSDGSNLSGIEVGHGGVYLCSTPNFLFIPIADDKPSGPPQILLDGWNLKDAKHNAFNGLAWGHDGWLYGTNGIQTKSNVGAPGTPADKRTYFDCGVWRFHPIRKVFEVYAVGMTNPWGVDWDKRGEMFVTNCVIDHLWHIVRGGRYQRMYGPDTEPFTFGGLSSAVDYRHWASGHWTDSRADKKTGDVRKDHDDAGGGHAHSGIAIYNGTQFPAEYQDTLFTCNIHGSRLNNDGLERTPTRMKGVRRPDFAFANDPWFRGVAVKQGPEGSLYIADWTDTGECHNYDVSDTTNGRLVRISYGKPKPFRGDVSKLHAKELLRAVESDDSWLSRRAMRVLHERSAAKDADCAALVAHLRGEFKFRSDEATKLRRLWAYNVLTDFDAEAALRLLKDESEAVRANAVRALGEKTRTPAVLNSMLAALEQERSTFVKWAYASAMIRMPAPDQLRFADVLFAVEVDRSDRSESPLHYWNSFRRAMLTHPKETLAVGVKAKNFEIGWMIASAHMSLPGTTAGKQLEGLFAHLGDDVPDDKKHALLVGVVSSLRGRKDVKAPEGWSTIAAKLTGTHDLRVTAEELGLILGDKETALRIAKRLNAPATPMPQLLSDLRLLNMYPKAVPDYPARLRLALKNPEMRSVALAGLAAASDDKTAAAVVEQYPRFTSDEKLAAINTLVTRPEFAAALLAAMEAKSIPKSDVTAFNARQILNLNKPELKTKLEAVWGTIRPASETRKVQTDRLKDLLTPPRLSQADLVNGRKLYAVHCATCHKMFGEGGEVGPELTGAQRTSLDYILENVLDPSAVVPGEYRLTTFQLADGRTLSGIIRSENAKIVTIRTLTDSVNVATADIDSRKGTNLSIMPDGLFDKLKDDEIRDMVGYLASPKQVVLPPAVLPPQRP